MLATLIIPFQLTMIPTFLVMEQLGLIDTLGALIVPSLVTPFGVFLLRQFFVSLPRELEEAAWIDGCSRLAILWHDRAAAGAAGAGDGRGAHVPADVERPALAADRDQLRRRTTRCQLGLTTFQGQHRTQWSAVMAGNVITVLPVLLAFLLAQRTFIRSLTSSAVKG